MRILDLYIARHIAVNTAIALFVLLALFTFFSFMDELGAVGKGTYGMAQAGQYVMLTIPRMVYQMFPVAALIGSIAGLGMLARNNELTVMRAAGVSLKRLTWSVMKIGAVMVVLIIVVGEWVTPETEHRAQILKSVSMSDSISLKTKNGLWARDGLSFVNVREILPNGKLSGVNIYRFSDANQLHEVIQARDAEHLKGNWRINEVVHTKFEAERVTASSAAQEEWDTQLSPDLLNVVIVKPDMLSALGLYRYVRYLHENGLNAERYEVAFWSKLSAPFVTGVMVFLAIPFAFGPLRSVNASQRVVVGTLLGTGFYLLNQVSTYVTLVFSLNAMLGALLPALLFSALAAILLRRVF